ncbi:MAG: hypothetical protein OXL40_06700 [Bacteroidota bacterium]|nr:hypothetical protein [Bacteroidota bacterium]
MTDWISIAIFFLGLLVSYLALRREVRKDRNKEISDLLEWRVKVNTDRKSFKRFVKETKKEFRAINKKFDTINDKFFVIGHASGDNTFKKESPFQLNERGEKVSKMIKADAWAERLAKIVQKEITSTEAYDIQEFSFKYVLFDITYTDEERKLMRRVAYENSLAEKEVREVLGVY